MGYDPYDDGAFRVLPCITQTYYFFFSNIHFFSFNKLNDENEMKKRFLSMYLYQNVLSIIISQSDR